MAQSALNDLIIQLRQFADERDWDQFHSPKNLAMALIVEAAELVELFQWLSEAQSSHLSPQQLQKVEEELADIQLYLLRLADKLDIDLVAAATKKIALNKEKYPAKQAKGNAKKYTEF